MREVAGSTPCLDFVNQFVFLFVYLDCGIDCSRMQDPWPVYQLYRFLDYSRKNNCFWASEQPVGVFHRAQIRYPQRFFRDMKNP
jgi:hypothetical protein